MNAAGVAASRAASGVSAFSSAGSPESSAGCTQIVSGHCRHTCPTCAGTAADPAVDSRWVPSTVIASAQASGSASRRSRVSVQTCPTTSAAASPIDHSSWPAGICGRRVVNGSSRPSAAGGSRFSQEEPEPRSAAHSPVSPSAAAAVSGCGTARPARYPTTTCSVTAAAPASSPRTCAAPGRSAGAVRAITAAAASPYASSTAWVSSSRSSSGPVAGERAVRSRR
ncbi:hypothetical protein [Thermomonospora catenispora]|uniref:hypothetical protein n=1 Tax=Thermomonospora catenispora TaxID=2493090 RepID=UPI0013763377|nr:hypothetical protein [Thermomonospora catenispora]